MQGTLPQRGTGPSTTDKDVLDVLTQVHSCLGPPDSSDGRVTSCSGDPDQVDGVAWSILRADPAAQRLCELYVRLQLVLGLRSCCKIGVKCQ